MDIKKIISEIFLMAFDLDYFAYLQKENRNLFGIHLIEDRFGNIIDCSKMFGPDHPKLINAIKTKGLIQSAAGYLVDAGKVINISALNGDLLFLSDTFLKAGTRSQYALIFHELCHLIIEAGFEYEHLLDSTAYSQVKNIRGFVPLSGDPQFDRWHTDDWFALLFSSSKKLAFKYPEYFESHQDALEYSMAYDVPPNALPMNNVEWI